jgi:hypothetical protein
MALVINPATGQILFTEDATAYLQQGYREPTAAELEHSARTEEFGGFGQQAQAQAERVLRGATLGAVEGFGSDEDIRARAEVSQELSPVTSFAASVLPDVGIAAVTGGLGGLATGAGRAAGRAALAEGAGIVRAGLSAARAGGAAALAGESLGAGAVAAGQDAYASGRQLGDDPGADAENLLIWGGLNFGIGAALMGASKIGRGASSLDDVAKTAELRSPLMAELDTPAKMEAAAIRQGKREAVDAGVERALNNASRGEADDVLERAIGGAPEAEAAGFGRQRRLYINREAIMDAAERELTGDLGSLADEIGAATKGDKAQAVASHVSSNHQAQRAAANSVAEDAAAFAGELRAEARAYAVEIGERGLRYPVPGQKDLTLALMDNAKAVQNATTGKGMFEALDTFKRTTQELKLSLEKAALNSENVVHYNKLIPKLDTFERTIRARLEDSKTWGKAGDMQRAYNAVISDKLMPSMDTFERSVLQRTGGSYDGTIKFEGWEKKIRSLLKGDDPGKLRHVNAILDGMNELAGVRRQFGDASAAGQIEARTAKVRRTLGLASEVVDATERMQALGEIVGGFPMGGAIAGGLAGGLPGAAIGAALPNAVRGFVMGDLISAFQKLSGATEAAAQRGVDDWIRSSRMRGGGSIDIKAALRRINDRLPTLSPEAKQLGEVAARRGVSHSMALFMGDDESPGAAFERWRGALLDQEKFLDELGQDYGALQEEAPEVFMALGARADLQRRYLLERMPPNVAVSMARPEGYPPNRDAIEDWSVYVNAVRFPGRVVRNVGGAQIQEIEALRTTAPRMHETLQRVTLETLARANETGEELDDTFLARIPILFPDLDGAGSPVFSRELGTYVRDYKAAQQNGAGSKSRGNPRAPQPNPMMATIQGGATFGTVG